MALSKTIVFKGIVVRNAYIRITPVTISPGNSSMEFRIGFLSGPEADVFDSVINKCPYSLLGENPLKQAYAYLKTTAEFSDAEDC